MPGYEGEHSSYSDYLEFLDRSEFAARRFRLFISLVATAVVALIAVLILSMPDRVFEVLIAAFAAMSVASAVVVLTRSARRYSSQAFEREARRLHFLLREADAFRYREGPPSWPPPWSIWSLADQPERRDWTPLVVAIVGLVGAIGAALISSQKDPPDCLAVAERVLELKQNYSHSDVEAALSTVDLRRYKAECGDPREIFRRVTAP